MIHRIVKVRTDIESPYNTYLNDGLPIGPILNPGEEAINAVLNPSPNDYLFFVARYLWRWKCLLFDNL